MIKLKEVRRRYTTATNRTSTIVRQLGFAGIAVIWVFKNDVGGVPIIPRELLRPGICLVVGLALDLLQYISKSIEWGLFNRWHEYKQTTETQDIDAPRWINWTSNFFFWAKIIIMTIAYVYLIQFLIKRFVLTQG